MKRSARILQPKEALLKRLFESAGAVPLSFEVFPPGNEEQRKKLLETVDRLTPAAAQGFSVTMGAGGTSRTGTYETAVEIAERTNRPVTAHLTAIGLSTNQAMETADALWSAGITRVLALRGDALTPNNQPSLSGFKYAADLVRALADQHRFEISVAAYPEKHPEADDLDVDIDHLEEKLDAGATRAYCQFVLDPSAYGRFLDKCSARGITADIIPGVMPLDGWSRLKRFAKKTETKVPLWLSRLFACGEETPELMPLLASAATVEQARRLIAYGAPELHVYTMNRWPQSLTLAKLLGS
ncbi:methylenetetrahydrofolate reductase [Marivita geojedonensis]|uniref:Methylenetetrahydrofolate reductase n=1 Tax=Marivita geojedonensis TaxID=1123756 RepID=A0A1X4N7Q4_9RHOB|nr:methylenetetrahydrofolate reductase [Marivita geojedonensis]OSQ42166.1 hypothetical protein MGEO_20760 [Marivita geojedonensis]PRY70756.1 5,10-methylenetetrahydrofolate reductase (NAD(P)) [Marivita geojedonensis]